MDKLKKQTHNGIQILDDNQEIAGAAAPSKWPVQLDKLPEPDLRYVAWRSATPQEMAAKSDGAADLAKEKDLKTMVGRGHTPQEMAAKSDGAADLAKEKDLKAMIGRGPTPQEMAAKSDALI